MIKKQTFCKILKALIALIDKNDKLQTAFEPFFDEVIFTHTHEFQNSIINALSDEIDDTEDYISWWIWDAPDCGKSENSWVESDGIKIILKTPEQLYDFLRSNK